MKKRRSVFMIVIALNWDADLAFRQLQAITKKLHGLPFRPSMHSKRQIAYIVQFSGTAKQLMDRLGDTIEAGCVENAWVFTPGTNIVCKHPIDPLTDHVKDAWADVGKWNKPYDVPPPNAGEVFKKRGIKDDERSAAIKMGLRPRKRYKPSQNPNQ